jgi:thiol-disulfide isomerase/thioredoxin
MSLMPLRLRAEMPDLSGITQWVNGEVNSGDLLGKPTLIHFWSASCNMCKASLPEVSKLRETYPSLQIVGIHMPRSQKDCDIEMVKATIIAFGLIHPQGIDNQHHVVDAFTNEFVPAFYLFDENGLLRHRSAGEKALTMLKRPLERVFQVEMT